MVLTIVVGASLFLYCIWVCSRLIKDLTTVKEAQQGIDGYVTDRDELIAQLITEIHTQSHVDKQTREQLVAALNGPAEQRELNISETIDRLLVLIDQNPSNQDDERFIALRRTLSENQFHIQMSIRYFNASVDRYNARISSFPFNFLASIFKLRPKSSLTIGKDIDLPIQ